jgi:hypothetical protein
LLVLLREEGVDGCVEEVATLEEIEFEDEEIARNNTTELLDEITSCLCGSTYTRSV